MAGPYYVDPAAAGGATGADWTNAWVTLQTALDTAGAGEIVYARGAQTLAATLDVDTQTGGNATGYIKIIGCNAAGAVDGTRFTIQGDGSHAVHLLTVAAKHMYWFENVRFTAAYTAKSGVTGGSANATGWVFVNCSFDSNAASGVQDGRYLTNATFYRCAFWGNGTYGYTGTIYPSVFLFCSFHDNGSIGLSCPGAVAYGCLIYDNVDDGMTASPGTTTQSIIINSVINHNTDDGVVVAASTANVPGLILVGCRVTNHSGAGDIGLNANSEPTLTAYCYFEGNDGDNIQNATLHYNLPVQAGTTSNIEDQSNTNQGYTDLTDGAEDFNLRSDASLRRTSVTVPLS